VALPGELAREQYCYLTTTGRVSGQPHTIEIWFAAGEGDSIFLLSGGRDRSDWVRNLRRQPTVEVRIGERQLAGQARLVGDAAEDALARRLLFEKYQGGAQGDLTSWSRTALPVAIDLAVGT
jgi:deazaflavin-dependent oxidoreductase (nitroreductase family)